jgi:hypothetical protein
VILLKNFGAIVLSILVFVSTLPAFATEEGDKPVPSTVPVAAKVLQITGAVSAISPAADSVTVKKKRGKMVVEASVTVDKDSEIMKGNEIKRLSDIKVGDEVVVKYVKVSGINIAKSIFVKSAKPVSKE